MDYLNIKNKTMEWRLFCSVFKVFFKFTFVTNNKQAYFTGEMILMDWILVEG